MIDRSAGRQLYSIGKELRVSPGVTWQVWDAEICNLSRLQVTPSRKMAVAPARQGLQACNLMPLSVRVTSIRFLCPEWGYSAKPRQYWARAEL